MFCANCGSEIPDGANFCEKCGMPVGNINAIPTDQAIKKPKKQVVLCLVGAIVLMLALGVALFAYYDMKILPQKIVEEISEMKLVGYEKPIKSAMDDFFDFKYNWTVQELGGRYYVTAEGIAYQTVYDFNFWFERKPPDVEFSQVNADGERLENDTDEYYEFMDEVFCEISENGGKTVVEETDGIEAEDLEDSLVDASDDGGQDAPADTAIEDSTNDGRYLISDEFKPILYDFVTEESDFEVELSMTYTRALCGRFELYAHYYDETGDIVHKHYCGLFDEDLYGNGMLKFQLGEEYSYFVDYSLSPASLILQTDDGELYLYDCSDF